MNRVYAPHFYPDEQEYEIVGWEAAIRAMGIAGEKLDERNSTLAAHLCRLAIREPEQVTPLILDSIDSLDHNRRNLNDLLMLGVVANKEATQMAKIIDLSHSIYHSTEKTARDYYEQFDLRRHETILGECATFYAGIIVRSSENNPLSVSHAVGEAYLNSSFYIGKDDPARIVA